MTRLDKFMMTMRMRFFTSTDLRHGTHGNSGYSGRVGVYRRLIIWFGEEAYFVSSLLHFARPNFLDPTSTLFAKFIQENVEREYSIIS